MNETLYTLLNRLLELNNEVLIVNMPDKEEQYNEFISLLDNIKHILTDDGGANG